MSAEPMFTTTTNKVLAKLREPFLPHQISKLPKPYKKDSPKGKCDECGGYHGLPAVHLDYVGHAALTDRLLDVDPHWNWEPMSLVNGTPTLDANGGLWIKLTICGLTRLGYGHADGKTGGNAIKEAIGDALRNAAMRFGAALDLWHKGDLHLSDDLTPKEQERAAIQSKPAPIGKSMEGIPPAPQKPVNHAPAKAGGISEAQIKRLYTLASKAGWKDSDVKEILTADWGLKSTKDMTRQAYDLFCEYMIQKKTPVTIKGLPVHFG